MTGGGRPSDAVRVGIEAVEAVEANMLAFLRLGRDRSWAEIGDEGDVSWNITGIPWAWANMVAGARFEPATADERIGSVLARYRERKFPMSWWLGPTSTPEDLLERLREHGLEPEEPEPGMVCDLTRWSGPTPTTLSVERVADAATLHEAARLHVDGFGHQDIPDHELEPFEERFGQAALDERSPFWIYVAREGGRPIATGWGLLDHEVVGIYSVATLPAHRRRGAGSAVTCRIMEDAKAAGARLAVLEASDMGKPIYEHLGFRTVCDITMMRGPFDER